MRISVKVIEYFYYLMGLQLLNINAISLTPASKPILQLQTEVEQVSLSVRRVIRSTRNKHQHVQDVQECRAAYEERISQHCRYPGMTDPCYSDQQEQDASRITSMTKQCCQSGCVLHELEVLCCRTPNCLKKCYGDKLTTNTRGSLNRYFDELAHPHPLRRRKLKASAE